MIRLCPITKENIDMVLSLSVHDEQKGYVSSVAESLAQAYVYGETAFPFAVYNDEEPVGFIMMGYYEAKQYYTLWKFMIDKSFQHKGYGRKALELGILFLKDRFHVSEIYTRVIPGNDTAKKLYRSVGFAETGVFENNMTEMCLKL